MSAVMGRPNFKYKEEYCSQMVAYFDRNIVGDNGKPNELPTLQEFACNIKVYVDTLADWANAKKKNGKPKHPNFLRAYRICKQLQERQLVNGALLGHYQSNFAIFVAKNYSNMRDQTQTDVTSGGEKITGFIYNSPKHDTSNKSNDKAG